MKEYTLPFTCKTKDKILLIIKRFCQVLVTISPILIYFSPINHPISLATSLWFVFMYWLLWYILGDHEFPKFKCKEDKK